MPASVHLIAGAFPGWTTLELLPVGAFSTVLIVAELILLVRLLRLSPALRIVAMMFGVIGATGGFLFVNLAYDHDRLSIGVPCMMFGAGLAVAVVALFRWCFQSCRRTLLLVMLLASIGTPLFVVKMQRVRRQKEAVKAIEKLGGTVHWAEPSVPAWLRTLLGEESCGKVLEVRTSRTLLIDADMEHVQGLPQLQLLKIDGTQVTDAGLEHLPRLPQLRLLWLSDTQVTDAGLEHLTGLTQLRWLRLDGTQVTDAGVQKLRETIPRCGIEHSGPPKGG